MSKEVPVKDQIAKVLIAARRRNAEGSRVVPTKSAGDDAGFARSMSTMWADVKECHVSGGGSGSGKMAEAGSRKD